MLRLFIDLKVYRKDIGLILQKSWDLPDHNIIHACIYFCSSRPNIPIDCYLQQWEWVQIKDRGSPWQISQTTVNYRGCHHKKVPLDKT